MGTGHMDGAMEVDISQAQLMLRLRQMNLKDAGGGESDGAVSDTGVEARTCDSGFGSDKEEEMMESDGESQEQFLVEQRRTTQQHQAQLTQQQHQAQLTQQQQQQLQHCAPQHLPIADQYASVPHAHILKRAQLIPMPSENLV